MPNNGDIIRGKKWVCYDWYFNVWQARVAPYDNNEEAKPCQFVSQDKHGSQCGYYSVSIEDIEE